MLPEAKAAAGHIVAARTLYYKVRPLVQKYTDKELDYDYFSQTLLPEYERDRRAAGRPVLRGARRTAPPPRRHGDPARHPRGGGLQLPPWQFDKVLYIEKTGLEAQLAPYQLGQQYDMAIIYGKGYRGDRVPGSVGALRVSAT